MAEVFKEPGCARSSKAARCVPNPPFLPSNLPTHRTHQIYRIILAGNSEEAPSSSQPTVAKPQGLTVAQRKIILASDSEEAPSSSQATIAKPRGLATAQHHAPAINTVISNFEYKQEGSGSDSEEEDEENNLEYPGDGSESLVRFYFCFHGPSSTNPDIPLNAGQH